MKPLLNKAWAFLFYGIIMALRAHLQKFLAHTKKFIKYVIHGFVGHIAFSGLSTAVTAVATIINIDYIKSYYGKYPLEYKIALFLSIFFILGFFITIDIIRHLRKKIKIYEKSQLALKTIGFHGVYPCDTVEHKREGMSGFLEEIEKKHPRQVKILAVTGWNTFGCSEHKLHHILKSCDGSIRVLLITPYCEMFKQRVTSLNMNEENFAENISNTIEYCKRLKKDFGRTISVKLYTQRPIWKMIGTESHIWLQYYDTNKPIYDSTIYGFTKENAGQDSLYYPLEAVFLKRWDHDGNREVNLLKTDKITSLIKEQKDFT